MLIVADNHMPLAREYFSGLGQLQLFDAARVTAEDIRDAEVLLVRSTLRVDERLLNGLPKLRYVGTATSGSNHLDRKALQARGIEYTAARGCNALAVAEYVLAAMLEMASRLDWQLADKRVGIVGAGMVGSALAQKLDALDIPYRLCDPPLKAAGDSRELVSMKAIMDCDIISLHVPLEDEGEYATRHLFDRQRLASLKHGQLLINACRGEVVDNQALLDLYHEGHKFNMVLDVWEHEPEINFELMALVDIATAHIAGHSLEGKARGTHMLYQWLCDKLNRPGGLTLQQFLPPSPLPTRDASLLQRQGRWQQSVLQELVQGVYDIGADDNALRGQPHQGAAFTALRKQYGIRREFAAQALTGSCNITGLTKLGFSPVI